MPRSLLFLCVANSARSQMAEGLARHLLGADYTIQSAGSQPAFVHPLALEVLSEIGIDASAHRSKSVQEIDLSGVDLVITLCAEEVCPLVPGRTERLHWPLPDPAAAAPEASQRDSFRQVRDTLRQHLLDLRTQLQSEA